MVVQFEPGSHLAAGGATAAERPPLSLSRTDLITDLLAVAAALAGAESELLAAQRALTTAKELLEDAEAAAVLSGTVDGKNADARAAQVRAFTAAPREAVRQAQDTAHAAALTLRVLTARFSALRAVARLLSGEGDR